MAGVSWNYVLKFIITGSVGILRIYSSSLSSLPGDAAVGKSSLLVRLTDQRFMANPDPTVRETCLRWITRFKLLQLGVEFGSKLITIPEENKVIKLQCT